MLQQWIQRDDPYLDKHETKQTKHAKHTQGKRHPAKPELYGQLRLAGMGGESQKTTVVVLSLLSSFLFCLSLVLTSITSIGLPWLFSGLYKKRGLRSALSIVYSFFLPLPVYYFTPSPSSVSVNFSNYVSFITLGY